MFGAFKSKLTEFGDKISDNAVRLGGKIASIDPNDIVDPGHKFGPLWELSEYVDNCRECGVRFQQIIKRKHHCRLCAGVFCDTCCPVMESKDGTEEKRLCLGCIRGDMPNDKIKNLIRAQLELEKDPNAEEQTLVDKVMDKAAAKLSETLRIPISPTSSNLHGPVNVLTLIYGSAFPDEKDKSDTKSLPTSGYFEFYNKSSTFCCVKVLKKGNKTKFEVPRPSYLAVPPNEYVHGFFDPNDEGYEIFLLYDNKYGVAPGQVVVYDTKARGVTKNKVSACAKVDEFNKISVFHVNCRQRNILLKYKGNGEVVPRKGNSMSRVGFVGKLQGHRYANNKLDYSTNVDEVTLIFSYSV